MYNPNTYTFSYKLDIFAPITKTISYLSTPHFSNYFLSPVGATVEEPPTDTPPKGSVEVYWRTTGTTGTA